MGGFGEGGEGGEVEQGGEEEKGEKEGRMDCSGSAGRCSNGTRGAECSSSSSCCGGGECVAWYSVAGDACLEEEDRGVTVYSMVRVKGKGRGEGGGRSKSSRRMGRRGGSRRVDEGGVVVVEREVYV